MTEIEKQLGVQSWCFRYFKDLDGLIMQMKVVGLSRIELCEVHVDFNDEAGFEKVIQKFAAANIQISSIGVQTFANKPAAEEKWFRFCKLAGAKLITATFDVATIPDSLLQTQKLAEKHDIRIGIHNHGGYNWLGSSQMLTHFLKQANPWIGLCLDSGWCLQSGENPLKWAELFNDRIYGIHIKDFIFDRAGRWTDVVVGTGNLALKAFLQSVRKSPHLSVQTIEFEGDVENPAPKLIECIHQIVAAS